jgi:hypothetical protein
MANGYKFSGQIMRDIANVTRRQLQQHPLGCRLGAAWVPLGCRQVCERIMARVGVLRRSSMMKSGQVFSKRYVRVTGESHSPEWGREEKRKAAPLPTATLDTFHSCSGRGPLAIRGDPTSQSAAAER